MNFIFGLFSASKEKWRRYWRPTPALLPGGSQGWGAWCLENPRDGEAWWAAIYGVAQSQTQLK